MRHVYAKFLLWGGLGFLMLGNPTEAALVGRWDLDESAGVLSNPFVGSIQGDLAEAAWQLGGPPTTYVQPMPYASHHLLFGGTTADDVVFTSADTLNPGSIRVGFWAKATGYHAKSILVSKWNTGSPLDSSWEFGFTRTPGTEDMGNLFFRTRTESGEVFAGKDAADPFTTEAFNDGQWHRIVGIHADGTSSLFVDGQLVESLSNPGSICDSMDHTTLYLGRRPHDQAYAQEPYSGRIGGPFAIADLATGGGVFNRWDLDEGAGTVLSARMGPIEGHLEGNVTWQSDGPPGDVSPTHVLDFGDSSGARVNFGNAAELNPEHLTVGFWAKATGNHAKSILVSKWNTATTTDSSWEFGFTRTPGMEMGNLFFRTQTESGEVFAGKDAVDPFTTEDFDDGQWHFFTGTHDGSHSCLYVDGRLIESLAQEGGISDSGGVTDLLLGGRPHAHAPEPFGGLLGGPLLLYDEALDAEAVRALCGAEVESLAGDLDGDGFVGGDDLDLVRSFWGQNVTPGDKASGDASGDGFVGGDDLDCVRTDWGQGLPPAPSKTRPVPEPGVFVMLALLLPLAGVLGRRKSTPSE